MGFAPRDVDAMSIWEFNACVAGYARSQGGGENKANNVDPDDVSDETFERMGLKLDAG